MKRHNDPDSDLYEEFDPDDPSLYEDDGDEGDNPEPDPKRPVWVRKMIVFGVALALIGNIIAFLPQIYNFSSIQFLIKNNLLSAEKHIQQYKDAVTVINAGDSKGTGFNIDSSGIILTNEHVINGARNYMVSFSDGKVYRAELLIALEEIDTAILKIVSEDKLDLPYLPIDLTDAEATIPNALGSHIYVVGNPLFFTHIANEGKVLGYTKLSDWSVPVMALDAPIYKGNSGSPVINERGNVIAVVFATMKIDYENKKVNAGLAVPIEFIVPHLPEH